MVVSDRIVRLRRNRRRDDVDIFRHDKTCNFRDQISEWFCCQFNFDNRKITAIGVHSIRRFSAQITLDFVKDCLTIMI